jgi:hypothetical protein
MHLHPKILQLSQLSQAVALSDECFEYVEVVVRVSMDCSLHSLDCAVHAVEFRGRLVGGEVLMSASDGLDGRWMMRE